MVQAYNGISVEFEVRVQDKMFIYEFFCRLYLVLKNKVIGYVLIYHNVRMDPEEK